MTPGSIQQLVKLTSTPGDEVAVEKALAEMVVPSNAESGCFL
jgi:quinol monooxygenase YgiN